MNAKYAVGDWVSLKGLDANKKRAHILEIQGQECEAGVQIKYLCRFFMNQLLTNFVGWAGSTTEWQIREMEIDCKVDQPKKDDKYET